MGGECTGPHRGRAGREQFSFDGMTFEDGCLIKTLSVRGLRWDEGVVPTLAELERFKAGMGVGADEELLGGVHSSARGGPKAHFGIGDTVKVIDGDLKHLTGVVDAISTGGGEITILPKHAALHEPLVFSAELLEKFFKMGDHVKIVGGTRHVGETGMVVLVGKEGAADGDDMGKGSDSSMLHIFSDLTQAEIVVSSAFVQECADVSAGLERLGQFELHDMVMIDRTAVGVVVKVEHSSFKVLTTSNSVQTIELEHMGRKKSSRGIVALDCSDQRLEQGTPLQVVEGAYLQRMGVVKHIFKSYIFVHSVDVKENTGIVCVRARQCRLADQSAKPTMQGYEGVGSGEPGRGPNQFSFVPQSPSSAGNFGGMMPPPPRGGGGKGGGKGDGGKGKGKGGKGMRDELLGKTVRVTRGAWKGYHGTVKLTNENTARVELHGKQKIVAVARDLLFVMEASQPRPAAAGGFGGGGGGGGFGGGGFGGGGGGRGGFDDGSQTPLHDSHMRTPLRCVPHDALPLHFGSPLSQPAC